MAFLDLFDPLVGFYEIVDDCLNLIFKYLHSIVHMGIVYGVGLVDLLHIRFVVLEACLQV